MPATMIERFAATHAPGLTGGRWPWQWLGSTSLAGRYWTLAATLLERFLATARPLTLGLAPWQWANGMALTLGTWWTRRAGGYNLYRGTSGPNSIDYRTPVGAASPTAAAPAQIRNFPGFSLAPNEAYVFALRAVGPGGAEEKNTTLVVSLSTDAAGVPMGAAPNPPISLQAAVKPGGRAYLQWGQSPAGEQPRAARWNVYHDAGTGTVNYAAPLATVTSPRHLTATYTDGLVVRFAVRAVSREGVEEKNTRSVVVTIDAAGPPDLAAPSIVDGVET